MSWIAAGLTFLGNVILIDQKSWIAFVIFFIGNSLWAYHWFKKKEWAALFLVSVFLAQNIYGIWRWR
jgi:hypothetical protein